MTPRSSPSRALAFLFLTSCSVFRGPLVSPERGGATWSEVTSAHFVLKTDLDRDEAAAASAKLEETYAALSDLGFASSDPPKNRVDAVYFRTREAYLAFERETTAAVFLAHGINDFERRPLAILGGTFDEAARANVQHELTHLFVRYYYPQAPVWLNEGLAKYLETMSLEGGKATLGRAQRNARFWRGGEWRRGRDGAALIPMGEALSPTHLRAMTPDDFYAKAGLDLRSGAGRSAVKAQTVHYQSAWCLVHVLLASKTYADSVHQYFDLLRAGEPEALAWEKALDEHLEEIEADYNAALAPPEVMTLHTTYTPITSHPERVRTMTDAEVHVLWARLRTWDGAEAEKAVAADLDEAGRDPSGADYAMVEALWAAHNGERKRADWILRRAVTSNPEDPQLWSALGWTALNDVNRTHATTAEAIAQLIPIAAKLAPIARSAAQLDFLAHVSLLDGKPDAAIGYEKAAVAVDPNCVDCLALAAQAMLAKGLGREALEVATLAQGIAPEGASPPWLATLVERARSVARASGGAKESAP